MYNQNIFNPAYAGSNVDLSVSFLARTQWVKINGSPKTQTLNVHGKLGKGLGLGLSAVHDKIGPVEETNLYIDASYTLPTGDNSNLALGIKTGFSFLNVGLFSETDLVDGNGVDPAFHTDYSGNYPNIGFGMFFYTDKFYAGLSVPSLLENYQYNVDGLLFRDVSDTEHWFGTMGYVFTLNDNLKLKPSVMLKAVKNSPISLDFNTSLFVQDKYEFGLSWRKGDSINAILGFQATPELRIGYGYDYILSNIGDYSSGSHEIMLIYDMDFARNYIKSPRFF